MSATEQHTPVLLDRTLELLGPALTAPGAVYVDGTLGHAGHAAAVLARFPEARLVGIDRDTSALDLARERLAPYAGRIELVHAVYDEIGSVLARLGISRAQAILLDLGVSSMQIDQAERGFSYMKDAPLDMRMDRSRGITAQEVVDTYAEADLRRILSQYGEEKLAGRIAAAIVRERGTLRTTGQLADLVQRAMPAAVRQRSGGHPAKRTFQALRIEVNDELNVLRRAVRAALDALAVGGRMVVLSYHSLEDRIVKQAIADLAVDHTPLDLPVSLESSRPQLRLLVRGAEKASAAEQQSNSRSASVRLRAVERIREAS
ncbi:16S rRNA (cytosine(1402)-N(4))-methyltransferase RsmH [Cumulibacter manganitolerans]|uniref:16S rRNA (cytosine(1402)-N(4))-methyltransferase RsmH n=1 Tax=Cumulibacter manganitolerans TaxID=1884992 RepID=UPI0012971CC4|nr:16S rRNA (cytosine(1402)-N(4))-methyltransferase RsmH [Cumulibacter manganitolerans]